MISTQVQEWSNLLKYTRIRNSLPIQGFFKCEKFCACSWDMKEPWTGRLAPLFRVSSWGWYFSVLNLWGCAAGIPEPLAYPRPSSTQHSYPILVQTSKIPILDPNLLISLPYLRLNSLENNTLYSGTYLYSPHMAVPSQGCSTEWLLTTSLFWLRNQLARFFEGWLVLTRG